MLRDWLLGFQLVVAVLLSLLAIVNLFAGDYAATALSFALGFMFTRDAEFETERKLHRKLVREHIELRRVMQL